MSLKHGLLVFLSVLLPTLAASYWANSYTTSIPAIHEVESVATASITLPADPDWQPVSLPKRRCQPVWEGCVEHLSSAFNWHGDEIAIAVPHYIGSVRVLINDQFLADFGNVESPVEFHNQSPGYAAIDSSLLMPGENFVRLVVTNRPRMFHRVMPFYIGPEQELKRFMRPIKWLLQDVLWVTSGICLILALLSALLSVNAGSRARYWWFTLIMLTAAARNLFPLMTEPSLDGLRISTYAYSSAFQLLAILGFVDNLSMKVRPRLYSVLGILLGILITTLLFKVQADPYKGGQLMVLVTNYLFLSLGLYVLFIITRYLVQHWSNTTAWVSALFISSFILTANDAFPIIFLQKNTQMQLAWLATLPLVLAFLLLLVKEQKQLLSTVEKNEQTQANAIKRERKRIQQDLHDGIGGRIAGLAMLAKRKQQPEIARHLEGSLIEVQQIMAGLSEEESVLLVDALRDTHMTLAPWMKSHDIKLDWQHTDVEPSIRVTPAFFIEITRILQELGNNAIKHASANTFKVRVDSKDEQLNIHVSDNGIGIEDVTARLADKRGLYGIVQRCSSLDGHCSFETAAPGAAVKMTISLRT